MIATVARRLRCSGAPAVADGDEHKCGDGGDILCDWMAAVVAVLSDAREVDGSDGRDAATTQQTSFRSAIQRPSAPLDAAFAAGYEGHLLGRARGPTNECCN